MEIQCLHMYRINVRSIRASNLQGITNVNRMHSIIQCILIILHLVRHKSLNYCNDRDEIFCTILLSSFSFIRFNFNPYLFTSQAHDPLREDLKIKCTCKLLIYYSYVGLEKDFYSNQIVWSPETIVFFCDSFQFIVNSALTVITVMNEMNNINMRLLSITLIIFPFRLYSRVCWSLLSVMNLTSHNF